MMMATILFLLLLREEHILGRGSLHIECPGPGGQPGGGTDRKGVELIGMTGSGGELGSSDRCI